MANGIYTALDNDMNYLAHYGIKGMKWYKHLAKVQQSLSKYAKGAQTEGIDVSLYRDRAKKAAKVAAEQDRFGNKDNAKYWQKESHKYTDAANKEEAALAYNKKTRVRRALAGAAASVIGGGLRAASAVYKGSAHVLAYLRSPGGRRMTNRKIAKAVRNSKVGKFMSMLGSKVRTAVDNIKTSAAYKKAKNTFDTGWPEYQRKKRGKAAVKNATTSVGKMN